MHCWLYLDLVLQIMLDCNLNCIKVNMTKIWFFRRTGQAATAAGPTEMAAPPLLMAVLVAAPIIQCNKRHKPRWWCQFFYDVHNYLVPNLNVMLYDCKVNFESSVLNKVIMLHANAFWTVSSVMNWPCKNNSFSLAWRVPTFLSVKETHGCILVKHY